MAGVGDPAATQQLLPPRRRWLRNVCPRKTSPYEIALVQSAYTPWKTYTDLIALGLNAEGVHSLDCVYLQRRRMAILRWDSKRMHLRRHIWQSKIFLQNYKKQESRQTKKALSSLYVIPASLTTPSTSTMTTARRNVGPLPPGPGRDRDVGTGSPPSVGTRIDTAIAIAEGCRWWGPSEPRIFSDHRLALGVLLVFLMDPECRHCGWDVRWR